MSTACHRKATLKLYCHRPILGDSTTNFDAAIIPAIPVPGMHAPASTNQRLFFCVESGGRRWQLRPIVARKRRRRVRGRCDAKQYASQKIARYPGCHLDNLGFCWLRGQNGPSERNSCNGRSLPIYDISPLNLALRYAQRFWSWKPARAWLHGGLNLEIGAHYFRMLHEHGCRGRRRTGPVYPTVIKAFPHGAMASDIADSFSKARVCLNPTGLRFSTTSVPPLAFDNLLCDHEAQTRAGNMLTTRGIDTKKRLKNTRQVLFRNPRTIIVYDDPRGLMTPGHADDRTTPMRCSIDDKISQCSRKSQRGHPDCHLVETHDLHRKINQHQFLTNLPDQDVEPDRLRSFFYRLFADQLNGAIGYPVQFVQVMQPLGSLIVIEKFCPKAHARHRRPQIMSGRRNELHPGFHRIFQAVPHHVQGACGSSDFGGSLFPNSGQDTVAANGFGHCLQKLQLLGRLMRDDKRHADDADGNKTHPSGDTEPDSRWRGVAGNRPGEPARSEINRSGLASPRRPLDRDIEGQARLSKRPLQFRCRLFQNFSLRWPWLQMENHCVSLVAQSGSERDDAVCKSFAKILFDKIDDHFRHHERRKNHNAEDGADQHQGDTGPYRIHDSTPTVSTRAEKR